MTDVASALPNWNLAQQRVLVRTDLNVPIKNCTILDDYRLQAALPTIDLILRKQGIVIVATHIGRPTSFTADLSTSLLVPWFQERGYQIHYCADLQQAYEQSLHMSQGILLLENLRFFPGEKDRDPHFVSQLAQLGDYYVNDAWATAHRTDSSITQVPLQFPPERRTIGLLFEQELQHLNSLLHKPKHPFVLILGGGKVADKLPLLEHLMEHVDTILLGPAIVFTFLKALDKPVGASLVDEQLIGNVRSYLDKAKQHGVALEFPLDYQIAQDSFQGPLSYTQEISAHNVGISIGPKTAKIWQEIIKNAQTIFYNGLMGDVSRPETWHGTQAIFDAMSQSQGVSIMGGGDSVAVAQQLGYAQKFSYVSTGGGATLAYLSGQELPGLQPFLKNRAKTKQG